jgi:hypothetical protein
MRRGSLALVSGVLGSLLGCGFPDVTFGRAVPDAAESTNGEVDATGLGLDPSALDDASVAAFDASNTTPDEAEAPANDAPANEEASVPVNEGGPDAADGGTSCVCDAGLAYATDVVCSNALLDINCSTTFGFSGSPQCGEYGDVVYCSSALLGLVGCNVDPAKTVRVMQRCK